MFFNYPSTYDSFNAIIDYCGSVYPFFFIDDNVYASYNLVF